jgi:hypothetical protein
MLIWLHTRSIDHLKNFMFLNYHKSWRRKLCWIPGNTGCWCNHIVMAPSPFEILYTRCEDLWNTFERFQIPFLSLVQCRVFLFVHFSQSQGHGKHVTWGWLKSKGRWHFSSRETRGASHTVVLPFTLKTIGRQKKNYEHSNISPCKNYNLQKNLIKKKPQNPSRYHNSITSFNTSQNIIFQNPQMKIDLLLPRGQNPLSYYTL